MIRTAFLAAACVCVAACAPLSTNHKFTPSSRSTPMADLPVKSDCYVLGDSIAVGSAQAVRECRVDAKIGISSTAIIGRAHDAALVVISAGSNDPKNPRLRQNLETIRAKASGRVLWVVPINGTAAETVKAVAARRGDGLIFFAPAKDNVHPHYYSPIAAQIRSELKSGNSRAPTSTAAPGAVVEPKPVAAEPLPAKKPGLIARARMRVKDWIRKHRPAKTEAR